MIILYILVGLIIVNAVSWRLKPALLVRPENLPTKTLNGKHDDWWWFLRWLPRRTTAFVNSKNSKFWYPVQICGSNHRFLIDDYLKRAVKLNGQKIIVCDVPDKGTWSLSWPLHLAIHTKSGRLFRAGIFRKDYNDPYPPTKGGYWTFLAFAFHKN